VAIAHACATGRSRGRCTIMAAGTTATATSAALTSEITGQTVHGYASASMISTCSTSQPSAWNARVTPTAHMPASVTSVTTSQPGRPVDRAVCCMARR
jgi:hypothetical protein